MVAKCEPRILRLSEARHPDFLCLLPLIRRQASMAFRNERRDLREELIQEVIANAFQAFVRLVERGKADLAYATPLAQYGIKQVRQGRRVGAQANKHDLTSPWGRRSHQLKVVSLDRWDREQEEWKEVLVEDRQATPADTAAIRLDFEEWLASLRRRDRTVALRLAMGHRTSQLAKRFRVSPARISQLRSELKDSWNAFQGEARLPELAAA
jgi:hypothetical protein